MIMGAMNPVMSIILNIGLVLVLFVGAKRVNEGLTTPGVIMAFMSYVTIILNSILIFVTNFCNVFKGICIRKTYQRGTKSA